MNSTSEFIKYIYLNLFNFYRKKIYKFLKIKYKLMLKYIINILNVKIKQNL